MSVSLSTGIITFLHSYLTEKKQHKHESHEHTLSLLSLFFGKQTLLGLLRNILTIAIAVCVHSQCLVKQSEERKFLGTKGPGKESSQELSFPGNESSRERKGPGTKVPGNFRSGNESSWERKVSGTKVPHRDYSFLGTKGLGHEKSRYRKYIRQQQSVISFCIKGSIGIWQLKDKLL